MAEDLPMACSLSGADLGERYQEIARFGKANLVGRSSGADGEELRFRRSPDNERRLHSIVAAETICCPFLDLDLDANGGAGLRQVNSVGDELGDGDDPPDRGSPFGKR